MSGSQGLSSKFRGNPAPTQPSLSAPPSPGEGPVPRHGPLGPRVWGQEQPWCSSVSGDGLVPKTVMEAALFSRLSGPRSAAFQ